MLLKVGNLVGCNLLGLDGKVGSVKECYFDDISWRVKYLVADLGKPLPSLIPVAALGQARLSERVVQVKMTRAELESCPSASTDVPVCRQFAQKHYSGKPQINSMTGHRSDPHLRSTRALIGYTVQSDQSSFGLLQDFVVDDSSWDIRGLLTESETSNDRTQHQLPAKKVASISWGAATIYLHCVEPARAKFSIAAAA
jgi:hypothetical protein